jgi:hypothetical protein
VFHGFSWSYSNRELLVPINLSAASIQVDNLIISYDLKIGRFVFIIDAGFGQDTQGEKGATHQGRRNEPVKASAQISMGLTRGAME